VLLLFDLLLFIDTKNPQLLAGGCSFSYSKSLSWPVGSSSAQRRCHWPWQGWHTALRALGGIKMPHRAQGNRSAPFSSIMGQPPASWPQQGKSSQAISWWSHPARFHDTRLRSEWLASPSRWFPNARFPLRAGRERWVETESKTRNGIPFWQGMPLSWPVLEWFGT